MDKKFFHYNKSLKSFSRQLRKNSTLSEKILWNELLKGRKLKGYQFHRQRPIEKYIGDFFCKELKLVIELDGESHIGKEGYDKLKQSILEEKGYNVIRFKDIEIEDFESVKKQLEKWIDKYERNNPEALKFKTRRIRS